MGKKQNKSRSRKRMLARAGQKRISSAVSKRIEAREKMKATVGYIAHHEDSMTQLFTFQDHAWVFPDKPSLEAVLAQTGMDYFKIIPTSPGDLINGMGNKLPYLLHKEVLTSITELGGLRPLEDEHFNAQGFVGFNGEDFWRADLPEELTEALFGE